jgi:predicted Zn-dependent peptidase
MNILNRKEIVPGIFISLITDPRFKQNRVSVSFLTQLNEDKASVNAVIGKLLTNSCEEYPDLRSLNARLSSLYAARLSESVGSLGDTQYIEIALKTIDSRYALEGEDILEEGLAVLMGCLFNPLTENGGFKPSVTENEKQACIDAIEAELNDKRVYSVRRATRLLCKGEPSAVYDRGTIEKVSAVTPKSAYQAYQSLLKTARIEIVCVGCNDFYTTGETFRKAFTKIERAATEDCFSQLSPPKAEALSHTEEMEVNQSKMVLGFKTCSGADYDINALTVMSKIYGGSATSKLFTKVREEMSLCYYCWAKFYAVKGLMLCECGVESDKIDTAKAEILAQLQLMRSGSFSDDEMNHAQLSLQNDLKIVNDSLSGIKTWYLSHIYRCDIISPEQAIDRYLKVTRDQIIKAADSIVLDTVYLLTGGEA